MSLPELAIRRSVSVYIACFMVILIGAIAFERLPVDLMPDMEVPRLTIATDYQGAAPEEVEQLISRRVENAVGSAPGVEEVNASSSEGQSRVSVSFVWGTNLDEAAEEVRSRLDRIRGSLPDEASPSRIFKFDVNQMPILRLQVAADMEPLELRRFVENQIQYRFERIPGVGEVQIFGGVRREIQINLSLEKLRSLNLSVNQVVNLIRQENSNAPAGSVNEGQFELFLRTQGQFQSLDQVRSLLLTTRDGVPVYLRDVAQVADGVEEQRQITRVNGQPGLNLIIRKQSGVNTVAVAQAAREEIERVNTDFPHIRITTLMDSSTFIERSIHTVGEHALLGSILAVIVLLVFLRNLRSTFIVSTAIPISLIATFALIYFAGFTLNTVTLGGLALGVGRLVDDAIVVLENIFRHREAGKPNKEAALSGTKEVGTAIIASTLTTCVVFLPIAFLSGVTSVLFGQLAFTVVFALMCSLAVAMTLIPVLSSKYLKSELPSAERHPWMRHYVETTGKYFDALDAKYQKAVGWALHHRKTVVAGGAATFVGALLLFPQVGVEMMPETDEGQVDVNVELATGTRVEVTAAVVQELEEAIRREVPEAENFSSQAGGNGWQSGGHSGEIELRLVERDKRTRSSQEIAAHLNEVLDPGPGVDLRVNATGGMNMPGMGGGGERVSVEIRGHDLTVANQIARRVEQEIQQVEGVTNVNISNSSGLPELLMRPDRIKAGMLGLNVSSVGEVLETAVAGRQAGLYREGGDEYAIVVRLQESDRTQLGNVDLIPISTPLGGTVPVGSLVDKYRQEGPVTIQRKDRERVVNVSAGIFGRDLGSVVRDIQDRLNPLRAELPSDFAILFGGEYEEQQESFRQLMFALILAVLLVYMVLAAQYESWRDPFIILFSVPLGGIGVVLALILTGTNLSIQALLGVILLAGIAVSNAILLVDYTNLLRRRDGMSVFDAVTLAGRRRLRPILMTSVTTCLALFPMALGLGEGGEVQAPMARVVIGGLIASTVITLLFVPTLYAIAEETSERRAAARAAKRMLAEPISATQGDD
jgi:HAE1 family hydrophobic/amphiphilic exporter-1